MTLTPRILLAPFPREERVNELRTVEQNVAHAVDQVAVWPDSFYLYPGRSAASPASL